MEENKLLVGYYRLSMEDDSSEKESNSIMNQRMLVRDYVFGHADLSAMEFRELYDDGYSGATLNRPAMQELLELIRREKVGCIVVKDFSRFSRDYIELGTYLEQILPFMGIRFISISDKYDSREYNGRTLGLDSQFKGLLADFYVKDQSVKVKSALETKREKGKYCAGSAPFGYFRNLENKEELLIVEEEAVVIRRVFELTLQRYSKTEICKLFNEENVKTPLQYMKERQKVNQKQIDSGKLLWTSDMVRKIINDKNYYGCMVYGKTKIPDPGSGKEVPVPKDQWKVMEGHHEPIVSKEVFEQAQALQIRHTRSSKFNKTENILNGYVKCGHCHRNLTLSKEYKGHGYYSCSYATGKEKTECFSGKLDNRILEQMLIQDWKRVVQTQIDQVQMQEQMKAEQGKKIKNAEADIQRLERKLEDLQFQKSRNYEQYHDGILSKEEFIRVRKELEMEQEQIRQEIQETKRSITKEQELLEKQYVPLEDLMKYQGYDKIDRELLEQNLDVVYVNDDGRVEICWKSCSNDVTSTGGVL